MNIWGNEMTKKLLAVLAIAWTGIAASAVQAQELNSICLQQVEDLCGKTLVSQCFQDQSMWDLVYNECVGDVQTLLEMDREANIEQYDPSSVNLDGQYADTGYSYGGILRTGPGTAYARAGSLADGDWIDILAPSGDWSDGYQWYYVNTHLGEGYHWGGIFCTEYALEGVLTTCSEGF